MDESLGQPQGLAPKALPGSLWLPLACTAALALRFCLRPIGETDTGWHVAQGRLLLAGHFLRTNTLNWPFAGEPWYPTTWLYDLAAALVDRAAGLAGLEALTGALLLLSLSLLGLACRSAVGSGTAAWLLPAVFFALLPHAVVRPHVATWCVFTGVLAIGLAGRRSIHGRWLRAAALALVALGSNLHAGAVFGAFALGCFALEAALDARVAGRPCLPDLALAALAPLALLVNPGGTYLVRFLFFHLQVQEVVPLVEFARPTLRGDTAFFALLLPGVAAALWRLRATPALALVTLVTAGLGLRTERLTQLFLLAGPLALAGAAPALSALLLRRLSRLLPEETGAGLGRAGALACVLLACLAAIPAQADQRLGLPWEASWIATKLPVRAAAFLDANKIDGRGFNSFADGGYLAYARPGVPTFADGRVVPVPQGFLQRWALAERTGEEFRAFLAGYQVEWALTTRLKERLGGYRLLASSPDWALVYWDETSEVWLRRNLPRFAAPIEAFEYRVFRPYGRIVGKVAGLDRAGLRALDGELARFFQTAPGEPFALVVACGSAIRQGRPDAAALCAAAESSAQETGRQEALALVQQARKLTPVQ